ncbi:Pkinase-domain-containing protein, partial [Patellaria atrata CBS 101060]
PTAPHLNGICAPEDRLGQVLAGRLQITSILGVGAYGVVYTAVDLQTNTAYAVKALNKIGLEPRQRKFQQREIQLHHQASAHPNVVSLVKIMDSPDCTFVVIEYCPEGDLFSNITEQGKYVGNDELARSIFLQILDAVEHCHNLGIYHRDLKPENILVTDQGMTVKLADFGLATSDYRTSDYGCGSTFYMSPECQQPSPPAYSCYESVPNDIWSLGVILVNLTCGRNPWKRASAEDSTFRAYYNDRTFLKSILPLSDELDFILGRVFEIDPSKRCSILELRSMIMQCSSLTSTSNAPSKVQSTTYFVAANLGQDQVYNTPQHYTQQVYSPSPQNLYASNLAQFGRVPASPDRSGSNDSVYSDGSIFSSASSVSSNSSTSSFQYVNAPSKVPTPMVHQQSYVSPPVSSPWLKYYNFLTMAGRNAAVQFHPNFAAPVQVY